MPEFQGGQFLPLMQSKWKQEEEQRLAPFQGLASGFQSGAIQGIEDVSKRKKSEYEMAQDIIKDSLKNVEIIRKEDGKPIDLNEQVKLIHDISSGQFKGWNNSPYTTKPKTYGQQNLISITPTKEVADRLISVYGINAKVGEPISVPVSITADLGKTFRQDVGIEAATKKETYKQNLRKQMYDYVSEKSKEMTPNQIASQLEKATNDIQNIEDKYSGAENIPDDMREEYLKMQSTAMAWQKRLTESFNKPVRVNPNKQKTKAAVVDNDPAGLFK